MILGKWNKSVILTYIGLIFSILGIYLCINSKINYALVCMMASGICDLFDGTLARMCKRTKEEKAFGIELDSLIDVFNFIAFPIVFFYIVLDKIYFLPILIIYGIFGIARLAHFNTIVENNNKPVPYYHGLPVTYAALIFPISYLLSFVITNTLFTIVLSIIIIIIVSILFIIDIKVPKPKLKSSIFLLLLAIILSIVYLFVL